jgi:hypothetical protein
METSDNMVFSGRAFAIRSQPVATFLLLLCLAVIMLETFLEGDEPFRLEQRESLVKQCVDEEILILLHLSPPVKLLIRRIPARATSAAIARRSPAQVSQRLDAVVCAVIDNIFATLGPMKRRRAPLPRSSVERAALQLETAVLTFAGQCVPEGH